MSFFKLNVFDGKPCKKCGSTLRYSLNKRCVECKRQHNKKDWQNELVKRRHNLENE